MTLIDSSSAAAARKARKWQGVYALVSGFTVYPGIAETLRQLRASQRPVAVVTSSPRSYFERVAKAHGFDFNASVCYHDCPSGQCKPHPFSILRALEHLGLPADAVLAIGDAPGDVLAAQAAGVPAAAALWGVQERADLVATKADYYFETVGDMQKVIFG